MDGERARDIIEGSEFLAQVEQIAKSVARWDDLAFAMTWAISLGPEKFPVASQEHGIYVAKTLGFGDVPPLRVFFKFDESAATLLWVEEIPPSEIGEE